MRGGLRPCWIASMEAPIIGPIADSNNVICTTFPAARNNPTYTSMTSAGPTSNLKAMRGAPAISEADRRRANGNQTGVPRHQSVDDDAVLAQNASGARFVKPHQP